MYFRGVRVEGQVAPAAVVAPQVAFLEGTNDPVNHDASGEKWVFREESNSVALAWFNKVCLRCPKCEGPMIQNNVILCRKCGFVAQADDVKKGRLYIDSRAFERNILWAANLEHLDWLIDYLGAERRERLPNVNRSMASRLPNWMKSANREKITKALKKLRDLPRPS